MSETPDRQVAERAAYLRFVDELGKSNGIITIGPCFDRYGRPRTMSGPFINADLRYQFIANRCYQCAHRLMSAVTTGYEPCDDFAPAYAGEWPEILAGVPVSDDNPIGVECTKFEQVR